MSNFSRQSSLGAATATIAGIELGDDDGSIEANVVGFGCPAVLSKDLSENYKQMITTVINDSDVIPRVSGATLANCIFDVVHYDWRKRARRDVLQFLNEVQANVPFLIRGEDVQMTMRFVDKVLSNYILPGQVKQEQRPLKRAMAQPVLFPPGTCVHFYRNGVSFDGCYTPCTFFSEIDVARTMMRDHTIKGYNSLFLELMRDFHDDEHFAFESDKHFDF